MLVRYLGEHEGIWPDRVDRQVFLRRTLRWEVRFRDCRHRPITLCANARHVVSWQARCRGFEASMPDPIKARNEE